MVKQVRFRDIENDVILGGLLVDDELLICGCCGGEEYILEDNDLFEILEVYDVWVDLSEPILGT